MSKCLFEFDEYGKGMGFPSIKDSFVDSPYEGKDKILDYLKTKGTCGYVKAGYSSDFFTGELIPTEEKRLSDGEYSWLSSLIYYVDKYNLRLSPDFEKKVLNS